ncbi:retrovirus-related pol polyprotein from transposon TNT 1-94 [Tanacetum coccineum]
MKKRSHSLLTLELLGFSFILCNPKVLSIMIYEIWQIDFKTTFLNGYLDEDIYMVQPKGFVDPKHLRKVCKLQRSIYGLKKASRRWNKRFDEEIKRMDNSKCGYIPMQERLDLNKTQGASTPGEVKRMQNVPYALVVEVIMKHGDMALVVNIEFVPSIAKVLPVDIEAGAKAELNKKAHRVVILCLGIKVLRDGCRGVLTKLETLYITTSLANKLYLKKKLYTFYMLTRQKISEHIYEFNKIILDLANIEVKFEDEYIALLLLTSLLASYEHFMDTLLYGREALTLEEVMAILNLKNIKERSKVKGMIAKDYM